jgi:hypothetical protein
MHYAFMIWIWELLLHNSRGALRSGERIWPVNLDVRTMVAAEPLEAMMPIPAQLLLKVKSTV